MGTNQKEEKIKNKCVQCARDIEIPLPLDEDEGFEGEIDWMLARVLKNSTVSVCNTCDPMSHWKRVG